VILNTGGGNFPGIRVRQRASWKALQDRVRASYPVCSYPPVKLDKAEPIGNTMIENSESKEVSVNKMSLPELGSERGSSLAVSLSRAEIDQQISTARAYPRSVTRVIDNVLSLATLDDDSAKECIYALPRAGKAIKGPSIRLAEIIASQWGNCRIGARVVHVDRFEKFVEAEGVFHDLETNTATTSRMRRRISDKEGRTFNEDMIVVTGNAACAIAKRNAILGGVPKAVWRKAYEAVESVIIGDVKTLAERRDRNIKAFARFGVTPEEIFTVLGVAGESDITLEHMGTLVGMYSAIKNSESTVEEMFPKSRIKDGSSPKSLGEKLSALAGPHTSDAEPEHDPETGEIPAAGEGVISETVQHDAETAAVLLAGQAAAKQGDAAFQKWWKRLNAVDAERAKPHLEALRKHIP